MELLVTHSHTLRFNEVNDACHLKIPFIIMNTVVLKNRKEITHCSNVNHELKLLSFHVITNTNLFSIMT